jgi:AcrR family transcriptional regulator
MGVRERQDRERETVRRAILDAARDLFVSEGYTQVSIRKIAERIEYSPAAIYGYFESKDDIFFALAEEGFRSLFSRRLTADESLDPLERVRRIFLRFYEFSKAYPEHFFLMFVARHVPRINRDWERFGFVREMKRAVAGSIQRCVNAGVFPPATDPHVVFRILSSAIYGVAVFRLADRLVPGEDPDALARDTLEAALTGLRAGSPISFRSVGCEDGSPASDERAGAGSRPEGAS